MKLEKLFCLGMTWVVLSASAQVATEPDWKETEAPPPPAFNKDQLVTIDMPSYVSLRIGVDPATLVITPDGIVRYVVVASNATGSNNAMYEGIRCSTGEFKTYARLATNGQWSLIKDPQWRNMYDNSLPSKHTKALARQGVCEDQAMAASSVAVIVKSLRNVTPSQTR